VVERKVEQAGGVEAAVRLDLPDEDGLDPLRFGEIEQRLLIRAGTYGHDDPRDRLAEQIADQAGRAKS
jgi:hypothetical protein